MPSLTKQSYDLYGGLVTLTFDPNARGPQPRYSVTDRKTGDKDKPVRGVTTILKDILDKPDLMRWPMNMSHTALFGAKFDETLLDYTHDWDKALLKPNTALTEAQLHEAMLAGARAHTDRRDRGADIGTLAHSIVENVVNKRDPFFEMELDGVSDEDRKVLDKICRKFTVWWKALNETRRVKVVWSEKPVYSRALDYAGTLDLCLQVDDMLMVLDFKTTNRSKASPMGVYPDYFLQLGGYSYALREEYGYQAIHDIGIVNVNKDGQLAVVMASDMGVTVDECERGFAFAVRLHDWLSQVKKTLGAKASIVSSMNPLASKVEMPVAQ